MHPETEIAADFWKYVNERGHGSTADAYPSPPALMAELERQYWVARESGDEEAIWRYTTPDAEARQEEPESLPPTGFTTLQEALYDYLLADVGGLLIAHDYELWLRAVTHILADVTRDPGRLVVRVRRRDNPYGDEGAVDSPMVISDDWDVLRRETFDFACRNAKASG